MTPCQGEFSIGTLQWAGTVMLDMPSCQCGHAKSSIGRTNWIVQAVTSEFAQIPNLRPTQESRNYNLIQNNIDQALGFQKEDNHRIIVFEVTSGHKHWRGKELLRLVESWSWLLIWGFNLWNDLIYEMKDYFFAEFYYLWTQSWKIKVHTEFGSLWEILPFFSFQTTFICSLSWGCQ